jgi:predicted DNA-binding protein
MTLRRAQLLLDGEQHAQLRRLARDSGRSMSEVVREIMDEHLARVSEAEEMRQGLTAVQQLARLRRTIEQRQGRLYPSFIDELREERDAEFGLGDAQSAPRDAGAPADSAATTP